MYECEHPAYQQWRKVGKERRPIARGHPSLVTHSEIDLSWLYALIDADTLSRDARRDFDSRRRHPMSIYALVHWSSSDEVCSSALCGSIGTERNSDTR